MNQENRKMHRRIASLGATLGAAILMLVVLPMTAQAAESPWWQVLTSSRPGNMWEPAANVQEIESQESPETGVLAAEIKVEGSVIGCLGAGLFLEAFTADEVCQLLGIAPEATESAAELEALLEGPFGTTAVEVTGGPAGAGPLVVTTPGGGAPAIELSVPEPAFGTASATLVSEGGSGRLVATITNLGDAPMDATMTPVTIVDQLPVGVKALGVETFAGVDGKAGLFECAVEATDLVSCTFEGALAPFEALEIEVLVSLTGEPPAAGAPGEVTVSGGNAESASAPQEVKVS